MLERLSQKLIGYRVKAAREAFGWTQERLTGALGFNDRQSVSDIENGKRALKPEELVLVSDLFDREIEFFIDPFAVAGEAKFSWRAAPALPGKALDLFEREAGGWIGLLRWLRENEMGRTSPLKQSLRLQVHSSFEDAQAKAEDLVETLELGEIPAELLIEKIEKDLDIPVLFFDRQEDEEGRSISGAACHLQDLGVILVNRSESEARRFYDLAHELFHILTFDAMKPEWRESNSFEARSRGKRIEQLANNFAAALLMPKTSLERLVTPEKRTDLGQLAEISGLFRVAPIALGWRLFNLGWIGEETCQALTKEKQRPPRSVRPKCFSPDFVQMLHQAIEQGRLSARKAAKTLNRDLESFGRLFAEHGLSVPFEL